MPMTAATHQGEELRSGGHRACHCSLGCNCRHEALWTLHSQPLAMKACGQSKLCVRKAHRGRRWNSADALAFFMTPITASKPRSMPSSSCVPVASLRQRRGF